MVAGSLTAIELATTVRRNRLTSSLDAGSAGNWTCTSFARAAASFPQYGFVGNESDTASSACEIERRYASLLLLEDVRNSVSNKRILGANQMNAWTVYFLKPRTRHRIPPPMRTIPTAGGSFLLSSVW